MLKRKRRAHRNLRGNYKCILYLYINSQACKIEICSYKIATKLEKRSKHDLLSL